MKIILYMVIALIFQEICKSEENQKPKEGIDRLVGEQLLFAGIVEWKNNSSTVKEIFYDAKDIANAINKNEPKLAEKHPVQDGVKFLLVYDLTHVPPIKSYAIQNGNVKLSQAEAYSIEQLRAYFKNPTLNMRTDK